jgi:hypothetical protein
MWRVAWKLSSCSTLRVCGTFWVACGLPVAPTTFFPAFSRWGRRLVRMAQGRVWWLRSRSDWWIFGDGAGRLLRVGADCRSRHGWRVRRRVGKINICMSLESIQRGGFGFNLSRCLQLCEARGCRADSSLLIHSCKWAITRLMDLTGTTVISHDPQAAVNAWLGNP